MSKPLAPPPDVVTPPEIARQFHRRLPDAGMVVIPNCGHVPMVEYPDLFAHECARFLAGVSGVESRDASSPAVTTMRLPVGCTISAH